MGRRKKDEEEVVYYKIYLKSRLGKKQLAQGGIFVLTDVHGNVQKMNIDIYKADSKYKSYMKSNRCIFPLTALVKDAIFAALAFHSTNQKCIIDIYTSEPYIYALLKSEMDEDVLNSKSMQLQGPCIKNFIDWRRKYIDENRSIEIIPHVIPEICFVTREIRILLKKVFASPEINLRVPTPTSDIVYNTMSLNQVLKFK